MFLYTKNGQVRMFSEGKINAPNFEEQEIDLTADQKDKLKRNWPTKVKDGVVEQEISAQEKAEKEVKDKTDFQKQIKDELKTATTVSQLKNIIDKLIV